MSRGARLRRRVNRRLYAALAAAYRRLLPAPSARRLDPRALRRVLVVQHHNAGDMIVCTPVLALLHEVAPQAEVDVLASARGAAVIEADRRVARIWIHDRSLRAFLPLLRRLRARRYDAIYSLVHGHGLREGLMAAAIGGRTTYRFSVHRPKRYAGLFSRTFRVCWSTPHHTARALAAVAGSLALASEQRPATAARYPISVTLDDAARARAARFLHEIGADDGTHVPIIVNFAAGDALRSWPAAQCAETIAALAALRPSWTFVLTPPPDLRGDAEEVQRIAGARVVIHPPSPRILDVAAVVARARLVLSPDTAIAHLASAFRVPVVALFVPDTNPRGAWSPHGVPHRVVNAAPGAAVATIAVQSIVDAVDDLARETAPESLTLAD